VIINILIGLAVLSVLILAHELGHFLTAKASRVKVEEFGLGFPPRLLSKKWGETRYSLNAVFFGGFTKLSGEEDPTVPRSLASKSTGTRTLILGAGALMNFILALLIFSITFMIPRDVLMGQVLVEEVAPASPAAVAGIRPGDIILSVDEETVNNNSELSQYVQQNLGKEITLFIQHEDATTEYFKVVPRWDPPEGEGAIGVTIGTINATVITQREPFWRTVPLGAVKLFDYLVLYKDGLVAMFTGHVSATLLGPVGIAQLTGEVAKVGIQPLLNLAGLFSLLLGVFNLLPLPAFDGGRIAFVFLEWVRRGKRVPPRIEGLIHAAGFALLLVFFVAITYQDIIRVISGESLIP